MFYIRQIRAYPRRGRIAPLISFLVAVAITLTVKGFEGQISNFSADYLPSFAKQSACEAINSAVTEKLEELGYSYSDLVIVRYGSAGDVRAIETDSRKINLLKSAVTTCAQSELASIRHSMMKIPLGAFTGFSLISNMGPEIPLTYCVTGSVNSRIESSFESAGVNRTLHHIRLIISGTLVTASVDYSGSINYETDFELAQSVIAGDIPTVYGGLHTSN